MKLKALPFPRAGLAGAITAAAFCIPAIFIVAAGKEPVSAYVALFSYTLGTWDGFLEVITQTIPLTIVGLGVAVAFRAGVFNIGGDGQLVAGAILAFVLAPLLATVPAPLGIAAYLVVGFAGGALVGVAVGWLRVRYGASEIIVTIILNYLILQVLNWLVRGPLQEPMHMLPWTASLPHTLVLPRIIPGSRVHAGLLVAAAAVLVMTVVNRRSTFGYTLSVVGQNPRAARYAGLRAGRIITIAMLISGGLAGLAGAIQISAIHQRLQDDFSANYGEESIAVALMARLSPAFVPLTAGLFAVLTVGAGVLQRKAGIPFPIIRIVEGVVIFAFLCFDALSRRRT